MKRRKKVRLTIEFDTDSSVRLSTLQKVVVECLQPDSYYPLWNHNNVKVVGAST